MSQIYHFEISDRTALEPLGSKQKFWFLLGPRRTLFKVETRDTGEDWAEKIASKLCHIIGLPHVDYELADLYEGDTFLNRGVICETCTPPPFSLILGNQLLLKLDPAYPAKQGRYKESKHTVDATCNALKHLARPNDGWMADAPSGMETSLDVFVGYIMLDAWIANQDRHHENWAGIQRGLFTVGSHIRSWSRFSEKSFRC